MKRWIVLGIVALAIGLVAAGSWAGVAWAQDRWESGVTGRGASGYGAMGPGMMGRGGTGYGYGMMGGNWDWDNMPCGGVVSIPGQGEIASLEDAETAVRGYLGGLGYSGLEVTEVMEFERNYYAIVAEVDAGIGAMELLVDKDSGAVGPEVGPNMMWNAKYGMMAGGGMMGGWGRNPSAEMTVTPAEALQIAQDWLDANQPGVTTEAADPFYGYYTVHTLRDGRIDGMLSVHGNTGQVWYHTWHGDFIDMVEGASSGV